MPVPECEGIWLARRVEILAAGRGGPGLWRYSEILRDDAARNRQSIDRRRRVLAANRRVAGPPRYTTTSTSPRGRGAARWSGAERGGARQVRDDARTSDVRLSRGSPTRGGGLNVSAAPSIPRWKGDLPRSRRETARSAVQGEKRRADSLGTSGRVAMSRAGMGSRVRYPPRQLALLRLPGRASISGAAAHGLGIVDRCGARGGAGARADGQAAVLAPPAAARPRHYTLKRKRRTSPSWTTYSFPSLEQPFS